MKKLLITALLGTALFNGFYTQDNGTIVKGINAAAPEKITENTKAKAPEEIEQKEENVLCFYSVKEELAAWYEDCKHIIGKENYIIHYMIIEEEETILLYHRGVDQSDDERIVLF